VTLAGGCLDLRGVERVLHVVVARYENTRGRWTVQGTCNCKEERKRGRDARSEFVKPAKRYSAVLHEFGDRDLCVGRFGRLFLYVDVVDYTIMSQHTGVECVVIIYFIYPFSMLVLIYYFVITTLHSCVRIILEVYYYYYFIFCWGRGYCNFEK
jgi:hypothetical protein